MLGVDGAGGDDYSPAISRYGPWVEYGVGSGARTVRGDLVLLLISGAGVSTHRRR